MSVYAGKMLCMAKYTLILESTEIRIGDVLLFEYGTTVAEKKECRDTREKTGRSGRRR